ncbi:hypothetical protein LEP1GSC035_5005 [Leptospira noguchii str. 2007001578]|uniref:Uncharacterized protein n=1 Tax=Leptospira noguchii str. 2007001578 TaxID=1049974 RepID=A0ABP2TBU9_9LEPT|nr:hypothetical protein LEP1GSC035_5005 [Leptospira noguchii str. 2007001578]
MERFYRVRMFEIFVLQNCGNYCKLKILQLYSQIVGTTANLRFYICIHKLWELLQT